MSVQKYGHIRIGPTWPRATLVVSRSVAAEGATKKTNCFMASIYPRLTQDLESEKDCAVNSSLVRSTLVSKIHPVTTLAIFCVDIACSGATQH